MQPSRARKAKAEWQFHASCLSSTHAVPLRGPVPVSGTLRSLVRDIRHGHVTGRGNVVNLPPVPCAAPHNWAVHDRKMLGPPCSHYGTPPITVGVISSRKAGSIPFENPA